jgi:hypothetical protein
VCDLNFIVGCEPSLLDTRGRPRESAWRELDATLKKGERLKDEPSPFRAVVGSYRAPGIRG